MSYAVVVGAVNIDIGGTPDAPLIMRDSNPGRIRSSLGGVGRNIAHNMSLLGMDVKLVTALGGDDNARRVTQSCEELGIDISQALFVPAETTSTYIFIANERGDMELAVSDMEIYNRLSPSFLETRRTVLDGASLVMFDTNIPAESVSWLAANCAAPLFCDPVSVSKALKLKPVLGGLHTLKPNRMEAELLSGIQISDAESLEKAADAMLETGLERVFISLSADGMYAAQRDGERHLLECPPTTPVNATGGGDAVMAALARAYIDNEGLKNAAELALAAGSIAVECAETINPDLNYNAIKRRRTQ